MLRRQRMDFWINLFKDMRCTGLYNDADIFHRQFLLYCFMPVQNFMTEWNLHQLHDISSCSKEGGPHGKTEILFTIPELKKKKSYHHNVHHGDIDICKTLYMRQPNTSGCLPEFINLFDLISFNSRVELMITEAAFYLYISII
jgi:hypothetical protein